MFTSIARWTWVAALLLTGCAAAVEQEAIGKNEMPPDQEFRHRLTVMTDLQAFDRIVYLASNYANDVDCVGVTVLRRLNLEADVPFVQRLNFRRNAVDETGDRTALFEWNICLEIDGVTYRAWRGFDPGPETNLEISCFVDREKIARKETDIYLCETVRLTQNPDNYSEVAVFCTTYDCTGFDDLGRYEEWASLNPISDEDQLEIAAALFKSEISRDSGSLIPQTHYFLTIWTGKPSAQFLKRLSGSSTVVHPGDEFQQGKGVKVNITYFTQIEPGIAKGKYETYCGPLCASGHTVIIEKTGGTWRVKSSEMDWVS